MHGVRKAMSEGVQIEEVIVWVEDYHISEEDESRQSELVN